MNNTLIYLNHYDCLSVLVPIAHLLVRCCSVGLKSTPKPGVLVCTFYFIHDLSWSVLVHVATTRHAQYYTEADTQNNIYERTHSVNHTAARLCICRFVNVAYATRSTTQGQIARTILSENTFYQPRCGAPMYTCMYLHDMRSTTQRQIWGGYDS